MSRHVSGLLQTAILFVLAHLLPVSAQQLLTGYQLLASPQGSGGLLCTRHEGVPSALLLLRQGFNELAPFFDYRPKALGGYAETRNHYAEASFQATSRQLPLTGVAFAVIDRGAGALGFAFEAPNTLSSGYTTIGRKRCGDTLHHYA